MYNNRKLCYCHQCFKVLNNWSMGVKNLYVSLIGPAYSAIIAFAAFFYHTEIELLVNHPAKDCCPVRLTSRMSSSFLITVPVCWIPLHSNITSVNFEGACLDPVEGEGVHHPMTTTLNHEYIMLELAGYFVVFLSSNLPLVQV